MSGYDGVLDASDMQISVQEEYFDAKRIPSVAVNARFKKPLSEKVA